MNDYRMEIINSLARELVGRYNSEDISVITGSLAIVLDRYEVSERCTDVVIRDDDSEQLIQMFLATILSEGKSVKTVKHYNDVLHYFVDEVKVPLVMVKPLDVMRWIAIRRNTGAKNVTLNNYRNCISSFYNWLTYEHIISDNPMLHIKSVKFTKEVKLPFQPEDIDILRSSCKNEKIRAILEVLHSTGIRCNELCNIKLSDVDFVGKSILIREGKGGKQRLVYFNGVCALHIGKYLEKEKRDCEYLFRKRGGGRMETKNVQDIMRELGQISGIADVHAHRFRHTFAYNLYRNGMEISNIQRLMGHSNVSQTMAYIYTSDQFIESEYRRKIV